MINFFSRLRVNESNNSLSNIFLRWLWIKWPSFAISCFSCVYKIKLIPSQVLRSLTVCRTDAPFFFAIFKNNYPTLAWLGDQLECELVAGEMPVHLLDIGEAHLCKAPNPSLPGAPNYRAAALLWNLSIYSNAKVKVLFTCVWPVCLEVT